MTGPAARRFEGKVVLITGAAGGIGRATAVRFATEGARLGLVDLSRDGLQATLDAVEKAGGTGLIVEADVTRSADVARYAAAVAERWGGVDCFFNNAGVLGAVKALVDYPEEVFDRVLAVNVKGVWLGIKTVAPLLRARGGGAIVNTASISGLFADFAIGAYNAAKAGVINLTRVTAIEYAGRGIRVNCVCPGAIDTPLLKPSLSIPGFAEGTLAQIPMRRLGQPEEMANVVMFLASDLASYVTGAAVVADGGLTAQTGLPSRIPLP
jgi:NAD(P)-dependent dehydrogenase (short-subunit alcohol dehydrogenase family)